MENKIKFLGSTYNEHSRWGLFDSSGICPTLTAAMGMGGGYVPMILKTNNNDKIICKNNEGKMNEEHKIIRVGQISNDGSQYGTVLSEEGVNATLGAGTHGYCNNCIQQKYSIRKLTPKECFRLMNFDDTDFYAAESVNSNTRLYSQAGNSIVVGCLAAIFSQLNIKGITPWNEMSLEEKYELTKINKTDDPGYEKNII